MKKSVQHLPLEKRADMAMKAAVRKVLEKNAREGLPTYIWSEGRVVNLSPQEVRKILARPL